MANSIKDMASSVDWRKMLSSSDAKHALIGSALGGLLLGGSSMLSDHDPEESKLAPVGDALTGALLGGVAGYAVPKGLAMFRDSGSLAPDNDKLRYNYGRAAGFGAAAGAGTMGYGLYRTLKNESNALARELERGGRVAGEDSASRDLINARRSGAPSSTIEHLGNKVRMWRTDAAGNTAANALLDRLRTQLRGMRRGDPAAASLRKQIDELVKVRANATRGYSSIIDLIRKVGTRGDGMQHPGLLDAILHPGKWFKGWTSASHYHTGNLLGRFPKVSAGARMGMRAGKYGLAGAGIAMLLHKLLGPSTQDNFKKK